MNKSSIVDKQSDNINRYLTVRSFVGKTVSYSLLGYAFCYFLSDKEEDASCIALIDGRNRLTGIAMLDTSYSHLFDAINHKISVYKAKYFAVAHTHAGKSIAPSNEDLIATELLQDSYSSTVPYFYGHYIVSEFDYQLIGRTKKNYI